MWKKVLAKLGIGSPRIELRLPATEVLRGETLHGELCLRGGRSEQRVRRIDLTLETGYFAGGTSRPETEVLHRQRLCQRTRLAAGECRNLPFELLVPMRTPISLDLTQVWLKSTFDVSWAVHERDYEPVRIGPDPATAHLLAAAEALGFVHLETSGACRALPGDFDQTFTQVFQLRPKGRITCRLGRQVQHLDLLVRANGYDAEIQVALNHRQPPAWLESHQFQDGCLRFRLRHNERFPAEALAETLQRALRQHVEA